MRKYGLIGYPLGHSFSRKYFTEKFIREGITDCYYENYELKSIEEFQTLILDNSDLLGLNVTIPYKSEILRFLNEIDSEAKEIGAVNVLKIKRSENKSKFVVTIAILQVSEIPFCHLSGRYKECYCSWQRWKFQSSQLCTQKDGIKCISYFKRKKRGYS